MSDSLLLPQSVSDLQSILNTEKRLIAVGNETKRPLSQCEGATRVSLRQFSGITQYEPSEYTFTVSAGTRLSEVVAALGEKRQYLPFDPLLVQAGATVGGTVASGLSGPGRFRYGGLRDFLLAVQFVRGDGKRIRAGGKVVKNAAGFDLPKFLVGSLGRYAMITELTFKVFPKPKEERTVHVECESHQQAVERMSMASRQSWELDAIDFHPLQKRIEIRIAGPASSIKEIVDQISKRWGSDVTIVDDDTNDQAIEEIDHDKSLTDRRKTSSWNEVLDLSVGSRFSMVLKVPTTLGMVESLSNQLPGRLRFSAAANVLWLFLENERALDEASRTLTELGLPGLVVKGTCENPFVGAWRTNQIQESLKKAFDPNGKFPALMTPIHVA